MRTATRILLGLLFGVFAGSPSLATAATISGITIVKNAGNTADFTDNSGNSISAVQSTVSTSGITPDQLRRALRGGGAPPTRTALPPAPPPRTSRATSRSPSR